jgi:hypothetical protein
MDAFDNFAVGGDLTKLELLRFEVITPDSFMWRVLYDNHIYYLYAEDYVPGLKHVKAVFDTYIGGSKWNLVQCKIPEEFESSSPVTSTKTYMEPEDSEEMMKYTFGSGYDFVFLARSNEDPSNAYFSEPTQRGLEQNNPL